MMDYYCNKDKSIPRQNVLHIVLRLFFKQNLSTNGIFDWLVIISLRNTSLKALEVHKLIYF